MQNIIYDLAIIGGGPIGIFTAYYAAMRNLKTILIESMPKLGGQPSNLYSQKKIYDVAGQFGITGEKLINRLVNTNQQFQYKVCLKTTVLQIHHDCSHYQLNTNHNKILSKAVIITAGNGPFTPRKLNFDYDPNIEGKQLTYFVQNLNDFKNQDVLVAGGGDTAVDWALAINKLANNTYLLHRRNQFRALESSIKSLNKSTVNLLTPNIITGIYLNHQQKLNVTYKTIKIGTEHQLVVDKLLVNYGMINDSRLLKTWHLNLQGPFIQVDSKMHTNRKHIYAAGDVVSYPGKERLITLGFAEGPIAVNTAIEELYPDKRHLAHSSSLFN
ncbi:NAD(P)/FAD-dependent oxidoreductase [Bombilactobacillus folatiphilus]|uniref:Ferredoxin--NADP reductase n=1 Tax=Bombilactobacillus folatiphilus TaxID=2923362 RepID=A0ABY4P9R0_9LACO|nr:NAD(P)/FAD-dependent oxidoreductase [Bombilactobacillus folatiphilus]UQS82488.1 NAD(P)/FAD-dependent oxidoreductase [Bombilactobacillus folatiphilus]